MDFWQMPNHTDGSNAADHAAAAAGGANAIWTGTGAMAAPYLTNDVGMWAPSLSHGFGVNDVARTAGLNYDEFNPAAAGGATAGNILGGVTGGLNIAAGLSQGISGAERMAKGGEQNIIHGGLDVLGGGASVTAGGLGLATALGYGGTAALGTTLGAAGAVAAPVAAAIGLGVAGDHRAEDMHLFGTDKDGNYRGAVEAAWDTGQAAGSWVDNAVGGGALGLGLGAATAGVATAGLEVGAAAADIGLGVDALGASSGLFGTAANADGKGTHNRGAFEALFDVSTAAGNGMDDLLGLDHDSLAGSIVGGATAGIVGGLGAIPALAGDVVGGVVGGVEALGGWIGDFF